MCLIFDRILAIVSKAARKKHFKMRGENDHKTLLHFVFVRI